MKTIVLTIALAATLVGCGGEPPAEPQASAVTSSGTFRGSYQCGADWWHVEQQIRWGTVSATDPSLQVSLPNVIAPGDDPTANAVDIVCATRPVPFAWGGFSYYNAATIGDCSMWSHRANRPWSFAAYVRLTPGGLQLYPGSPSAWEMDVRDVGTTGTRDGIGSACGGHFLLLLQ